MASHVVGANPSAGVGGAGGGAGGDDENDDRVRRFFEASYDNLIKLDQPAPKKCPRCQSTDIKFVYYNNHQLTQPRYFCHTCQRYWTHGGALRDIPVGGNKRKRTPEVVPTVAPAIEPEQMMQMVMPMLVPIPEFEGGLSMMPNQMMIPPPILPNPVMNNHQEEVPSFYPVTTTPTTGRSSMGESSASRGWYLEDIVNPPPPPPPQPQPQQPEVVNLNHGDEIDDEDDEFNTIMQWSLEDLLASDDE